MFHKISQNNTGAHRPITVLRLLSWPIIDLLYDAYMVERERVKMGDTERQRGRGSGPKDTASMDLQSTSMLSITTLSQTVNEMSVKKK